MRPSYWFYMIFKMSLMIMIPLLPNKIKEEPIKDSWERILLLKRNFLTTDYIRGHF